MEEEVYLLHLHLIHVRSREGSASSVPQSVTLERLNRANRHFYQSHGVPYEGDMLYLGKTMFPATYSTSRAELEKAENEFLKKLRRSLPRACSKVSIYQ